MKVYLAARFQNKPLLQEVRGRAQTMGLEITSRWLDGDPQSVEDNALMDLSDVADADAIILYIDKVAVGERPMQGAWTEFGYALALDKFVVVIGAELTQSIFVHLPEIHHAANWDEALRFLAAIENFGEPH